MLEFKKACERYEAMCAVERELLLTKKSASVLARLKAISPIDSDPEKTLAGFIMEAVTADGSINEKEYLMIYPALAKAFGEDFDFSAVKSTLKSKEKCNSSNYTENMALLLTSSDDQLKRDVITICLCVTSIDRKITSKEKRYIRQLCEKL